MESYDPIWERALRDDHLARSTSFGSVTALAARTTVVSDGSDRLLHRAETNVHSVAYPLVDRSTGLIAFFSVDSTDIGSTLMTEIGWDI